MVLATDGRSLPPVSSQLRREVGEQPASDVHSDGAAVAARSPQTDPNPRVGGVESSESAAGGGKGRRSCVEQRLVFGSLNWDQRES